MLVTSGGLRYNAPLEGGLPMALKEKAIRRLASKCRSGSVPMALGGEYALVRHGLTDTWHAFDICCPRSSYEAMDRVLTRLGMKSREEVHEDWCEAEYHFDGADLTVHAGVPRIPFTLPETLPAADVFGEPVTLLPPADALALCLLKTGSLPGKLEAPDPSSKLACFPGVQTWQDLEACLKNPE